MFSRLSSAIPAGARMVSSRVALGLGVAGAISATTLLDSTRSDSTRSTVEETLAVVKKIQADLGISDDGAAPRFTAAQNYPTWTDKHTSLTRKYCTPAMYEKMSAMTTPGGFTFDQVIQAAIDLPMANGVHIGCLAGDEESYVTFAEFFDKVIDEYHNYSAERKHPTDLDYTKLRIPAFDPKYVLSTRIRAGRSVKGLALPPGASRATRKETERLITTALASLDGELKGKYYSLMTMTPEENEKLIADHFLFENPDSWTQAGGFGRDWPDGRGIYLSGNKKFLVWVNEEDHMRIISMQKGSDVVEVFRRFADACNAVETSLVGSGAGFAHSERLGYITSCPTNLGTGMRASVHCSLPLLGKVPGFKKYAHNMGLQIRGKGGEKDMTYTGVWDVSNRHRLGYSEVQLVQTMLDGLEKLIALEQKLERGETVTLE